MSNRKSSRRNGVGLPFHGQGFVRTSCVDWLVPRFFIYSYYSMNLLCPKCGKSWDEEEIRMQMCKDCSQGEIQPDINNFAEKVTSKKDKLKKKKQDTNFFRGYLKCPVCNTPWNWNEIGYQSCNRCGYENSRLATGVQIKRIFRAVMKYLFAVIVAVFVGTLIGYGYEDQSLTYLIASIVKIIILIYFVYRHFKKIKTFPKA